MYEVYPFIVGGLLGLFLFWLCITVAMIVGPE